MWKRLKASDLFLSFKDEYEIYVTDFITIWYTRITRSSFIGLLKDSNSLLEMSDDAILQKGLLILSYPERLKTLNTKCEENYLEIDLTMSFNYNFRLSLKLNQGSKELFFKKVTQPLLRTNLELKNSQLELLNLLNKKDSEIEEYKCEGGEIALKHLKTRPFDERTFLKKAFQEPFDISNDVFDGLLSRHIKTPVEMEPLIMKTEPLSQPNTILPVKMELNSQSSNVKQQPSSPKLNRKEEPNSQNLESESTLTVSATTNLKQEPVSPIKREPEINNSRKKIKKLF